MHDLRKNWIFERNYFARSLDSLKTRNSSFINLFRDLFRGKRVSFGCSSRVRIDDYANAPSCASRLHEARMRPAVDKYLLM